MSIFLGRTVEVTLFSGEKYRGHVIKDNEEVIVLNVTHTHPYLEKLLSLKHSDISMVENLT